ncbi:ribonucleoside-diphosphate reductase subunit alpha [Yinghuangia sp. YIM S09857]|uniref:ribonucleoside-diphosphate reductase subunit alpha n=1 Tax=Yinghuangia sp. YIM S09857 TaxID=3436929 RepID=UPI003F53BAC1
MDSAIPRAQNHPVSTGLSASPADPAAALAATVAVVEALADDLHDVDPRRVATRALAGLHTGATDAERDALVVRTAAELIAEEPEYSRLAARLLARTIDAEVRTHGIAGFSSGIALGHTEGLVGDETAAFVAAHAAELDAAVDPSADRRFEYFGLRTVYDRYLLRHPVNRAVVETPQHFLMRVACGLAKTAPEAVGFYRLMSSLAYLPSSPTLFNSGTRHTQMSSCYLLDSPQDNIESIYDMYGRIARLSKFAGGIGVAWSRIRSRGALIRGTNGHSNGIVPWLNTLDASVQAVNQCFAPETPVFTADGPKAIGDVQIGDLVLGISGEYRAVEGKFAYLQRDPMVRVDVKHGIAPLDVTAGHPFYAVTGVPMETTPARTMRQLQKGTVRAAWTEAGHLQKGDFVAQVIPTETVPVEGLTDDDARLYGILLGDGHLAADGREWGVSGNPDKDTHLQFVRDYLAERDIHYWETARGTTYAQVRWAAGRGVTRDLVTGRVLGAGPATLPFTREDIYDGNRRKRIARRFAHLPKSQAMALIRGLLETDGGVLRGKEIYFTSTSEPLAEGLRYQFLRLGVPCAGRYRERTQDHEGIRSDGGPVVLTGLVRSYDLRIPAVPEIAELVGCAPMGKRNWFIWQGCVFSRVRSVRAAGSIPVVVDLKVEGDESYMTSSALVHNGGKRRGAACVYLEPWHPDVLEFLELRDNTGEDARRTHNLNLANWIPDLFMRRVEADGIWSLFDPDEVPELPDLWGAEFDAVYEQAELDGRFVRQMPARDLYARMMRTLAQTGNGWMTFKDASNRTCNQAAEPGNVVHLSNLCTEILEVTSDGETAVCNLGSVQLGAHVTGNGVDWGKLRATVRTAVTFLDRVIDINYYPTGQAAASNPRWRPVGLGVMGLQDVFFRLRLPFDSAEARELSTRIAEEIYLTALETSCDLAKEAGPHPAYAETHAARGRLQPDLWEGVTPTQTKRWDALRDRVAAHGLRNSLLVAVAPTATIASIAGAYECIEPQVSNLFKRETLSGEFLQVNTYLVGELKRRGLWTAAIRERIKRAEGSVQDITELPEDVRLLYRTAWELPQRALIDLAAARSPYIDQSQSLNLFMADPTIGKLSSMYRYAWSTGLKTTYYLRSRPATRIQQATVAAAAPAVADEEAVACSLENPEACEACQ